MIEFNTSGVYNLQQKSDTGFNGTAVPGYATAAYSVGGVIGTFRARLVGVFGNSLTVQMVKGQPGVFTLPQVRLYPTLNSDGIVSGYTIGVTLATNSSGTIISTLSDVATAIAGYRTPQPNDINAEVVGVPAGSSCPIRLSVATNGTITAADASPHTFSGGFDPTLSGSLVRYDIGTGLDGGLFTISANEPRIIKQVLSSGGSITGFKIVNLDDGLVALAGESVDLSGTLTSGQFLGNNQEITFDPATQGVSVTAPAGIVQVWIERASRRQ